MFLDKFLNPSKWNEEKVKKALFDIQIDGKKVYAGWDAGNDSCICDVRILDKNLENVERNSITWKLCDVIIDVLNLPSASDDQYIGEGIVKLNENQEVILTYDNTYSTPYGEKEEGFSTKLRTVKYEDIYGITQFLSRAEISIFAYKQSEENQNIYVWKEEDIGIQSRVIEGDEIDIQMGEAEIHLKSSVLDIINPFLNEFNEVIQHEAENLPYHKKHLDSIDIEGSLNKSSVLQFRINKTYEYITYTQNKTIVLIP